jgi:N4-(beta-N-acetylglucosaminyl)-L-asparaginase
MSRSISRRDLLRLSAASAIVAGGAATAGAAPAVHAGRVRPVVIASANGHKYTNGGPRTCVETAFAAMTSGGDVLEALIAGVNLCELDPLDDSVGYGGLPNADGVVQLDACCMHGPLKRAGGVACLEGCVRHRAWRRQ